MLNQKEQVYLKDLAKVYKEIALSEKNQNKKKLWYDINDLKEGAKPAFINHYWPPVAIDEILPTNSFKCESEMGRHFESYLRMKLFYAQELDDDNVLEPVIYSKLDFSYEDYGGLERKTKRAADDISGSGAYEMLTVINDEEDINKITDPVMHYNKEKSRENYELACELFQPELKVIKNPFTLAAKIADEFSWLRGMENTYMDMYDSEEWMHEALNRIMKNTIKRFKMFEECGVWGTLDNSEPLGSAGLRYATGITDYSNVENPFDYKVRLADSWGFTCAEVFNCVSSEMHNEFSFKYDKEVMNLFKYINVGCCEVLDHKIPLIKGLPNTRKVSVSEWCDPEYAAQAIKRDYVYSYRAAGNHFVYDNWDKESAEKELRKVLESSKKHGCNTEIVLNIGGKLGTNPHQKVIEWSKLCRNLINEYYE